ncbi:hypothetical protein [Ruegeria marina]|uniref:Tat pathway signal sequence domain protein n=1 Tax=Ruegeria marina TaxID=639004 RepID=A0A1G7CVQ0_9RHOB|nr:hypothetical protein [Ruegeria marina]SDE43408.1 hypothetical protein SAMN04488239_11939 [Ruegeria marina]
MIRQIFAAMLLAPTAGLAQFAGPLVVELNKLEPGEGDSCRAYFLFRNQTGMSFEALEMSLALLQSDGVIDRLVTVDASPLPVARTTLKLFEFPQTRCDGLGEILLHEIGRCKPQNRDEADCFEIIEIDSKASVPLVK